MKRIMHVCKRIIESILTLKMIISCGSAVIVNGIVGLKRDTRIIADGAHIEIGKLVNFDRGNYLKSTSGGLLKIGDYVNVNRNCMFVCHKRIVIGNRCMFGPNVLVYDHDHCFNTNGVQGEDYKTGDVVIEDNCWIGAGAIILRNTHIGEGCVIGAGTVLKGDIPPHSLVTSNRILNIVPIEDK